MEIESIKKDPIITDDKKYLLDGICFEDYIDFDCGENDEKIICSINQIMFNDNLAFLKNDFDFLSSYLVKNDYIFPHEFIIKILLFLKEDQNFQEIRAVLRLLKQITAFDSEMQQILIENDIFNLLSPYFLNEEVIDTFSNLSLATNEAKVYLLNSNIIEFIIDNINDEDHFECLILLSRNILYCNDSFSFDEYISQFIQLFHLVLSKFNSYNDASVIASINAIRDYINADENFFDDFISNDFLLILLNGIIFSYDFLRPLLRICEIIVDNCKVDGAQYLINNNIIGLIAEIVFNENQEIRTLCFIILYNLVDYSPEIIDDLINDDFHTIAVSEFNRKSSFRCRSFIFKFCSLLVKSSSEYVIELIETGVVNILIENPFILEEDDDDWYILLDAIYRLKYFLDYGIVQDQINEMLDNEDFMEWIDNACQSKAENISSLAFSIRTEILFMDDDQFDE